MNIRYILFRIGALPDHIEIEEAIPLVELYNQDINSRICPLTHNP